jgi:iron complex transport system permease protein
MAINNQLTVDSLKRGGVEGLSLGLVTLLFLSMVATLATGRYEVSAAETLRVLASPFGPSDSRIAGDPDVVIRLLRLPRVILVVLSGMGLALAGAAMQGVFRNPLVGPEILGVTAGASFGGVLAMSLGLSAGAAIIPFSFAFGCGALALAFLMSRLAGQRSALGLVLAGLVVGGLFGALTGVATYLADPQTKLPGVVFWLMGSFAASSRENALFLGIVSAVTIPPLLGLSWRLNLLSMGEADAASLGTRVALLRWTVVALVSLFVSAQVAVSGGVGWVGLVAPHVGRMLVGPDHCRLLPISALLGGEYLLIMDTLARTLTAYEVPIGVLTSLAGAPVFAFFFIKLRGRGWSGV